MKMKMNTKNLGIMAFLAVLVIAVVFISGCLQQEPTKPNQTTPGPGETTPTEQPAERPPTEQPTERPTGKQNDANTGDDVSAELESPHPIVYGEWKGTLTEDDDGDAYGIRWNPGDTLDIVITPARDLDIAFTGRAKWEIELRNAGVRGEPESIQMTADITDNIKRADILISRIAGSGNYILNITATPQNDGGKGQDAPYARWEVQALVISAGKYEGCYLGSKDEFDSYEIKLNAGQKLKIKVTPSKELDIGIGRGKDSYCYMADEYCVNDNFKGEVEETEITADEAGIYHFVVKKIGNTKGTYTLEISVQ